jgi:hypothetical protein
VDPPITTAHTCINKSDQKLQLNRYTYACTVMKCAHFCMSYSLIFIEGSTQHVCTVYSREGYTLSKRLSFIVCSEWQTPTYSGCASTPTLNRDLVWMYNTHFQNMIPTLYAHSLVHLKEWTNASTIIQGHISLSTSSIYMHLHKLCTCTCVPLCA